MGFGAIVQYHYDDGKKFQFLQKPVILISSVPKTIAKIIKEKSIIECNKKLFDKSQLLYQNFIRSN